MPSATSAHARVNRFRIACAVGPCGVSNPSNQLAPSSRTIYHDRAERFPLNGGLHEAARAEKLVYPGGRRHLWGVESRVFRWQTFSSGGNLRSRPKSERI